MSAVIKITQLGKPTRFMAADHGMPSDILMQQFLRGTSIKCLSMLLGYDAETIEDVIRWYINNPSENPFRSGIPKPVER